MTRTGAGVGARGLVLSLTAVHPSLARAQEPPVAPSRLAVVWSSADPDVAKRVCFMYTHAAKRAKWFDVVHLVVWGPMAEARIAFLIPGAVEIIVLPDGEVAFRVGRGVIFIP